jgi:hypothetical protein
MPDVEGGGQTPPPPHGLTVTPGDPIASRSTNVCAAYYSGGRGRHPVSDARRLVRTAAVR